MSRNNRKTRSYAEYKTFRRQKANELSANYSLLIGETELRDSQLVNANEKPLIPQELITATLMSDSGFCRNWKKFIEEN